MFNDMTSESVLSKQDLVLSARPKDILDKCSLQYAQVELPWIRLK